uniref:Uncharacterized protein n=1 Tax=Magnetospirillum gryphiswaldense TaxID=55518 RepID=A4TZ32_9PROT|nr:hypothetical protein MGR_1546 [Magnetospirillum gryphiswaldense MSR-1]
MTQLLTAASADPRLAAALAQSGAIIIDIMTGTSVPDFLKVRDDGAATAS